MRGDGRGWVRVATLVGLLACGCQGSGAEAEQPEADDDSEAEPTADPPTLLEPVGELVIAANSRDDLPLTVSDLDPAGRIEIDGRSWTLTELGPAVREGDLVRIPLAGALVVGSHELVFVQGTDADALRSDPLLVRIEASELKPLEVALEPALVGVGDALVVAGPDESLLAVIDAEADTVELRRGDWSAPGVIEPLPGLAWPSGPVTGGLDLTVVELEQGRALLSLWLADGGTRVFARITPITPIDADDQLGPTGAPVLVWDLNDPDQRALLGPHQLAHNHAVALLDRRLVVAVEARRDAEHPSPGDQLLMTRWLAADGAPASVEILRGPGSRDLDLPLRAQRWLDQGEPTPLLSVRLALAFPWLLELAGNGLPSLTGDPGESIAAPGSPVWMASADGALGSGHVFSLELALDDDPPRASIRAVRVDRWGASDSAGDVVELPAIPTAAPSLSSIGGAPVLLIPFGLETPSWAMRSTGDAVVLDEFAQLPCDAFALAQPTADADGDTRTFACMADRALRLGALGVK